MSATTIGSAVEAADNTPKATIERYRDDFAAVLPSHVANPDLFVRLAQSALKKGKRIPSGGTDLELAANNNPGVFIRTLLDCARLGLEPGTEQFYLTPRKVGGKLEILGIVGYQGLVELMYRAGAVASVVAECVYTNDGFTYAPGRHERPVHEIDWDLPDRGDLRLVYAYAVMKDGATSKVVVLNSTDITRIKSKSQGADSEYSPWKTNTGAMWLKSAVRQLAKWVPTSSEYIRERLRIEQEVGAAVAPLAPAPAGFAPDLPSDDSPVLDDEGVLDVESYEPDDDGRPFTDGDPGPVGWDS